MVFVTSAAFRLVVVIFAAAIPVVQGVQKALEFCHPKKDSDFKDQDHEDVQDNQESAPAAPEEIPEGQQQHHHHHHHHLVRAGHAVASSKRGIKNGSNYCYLNASIQMLLALPGVRTMVFRSVSGMVPGNDVDTNNTCPTKEDAMKVIMAAKRFTERGGTRADGDTVFMAKRITVHVLGWAFKELEQSGCTALDMNEFRPIVHGLSSLTRRELKPHTQEDASEATLLLLEAVLSVAEKEAVPMDAAFLTWRKDNHLYCLQCREDRVTPAVETGMVTLPMDKDVTTNTWHDLTTLLTNEIGGGVQSEVEYRCPCEASETSNLWCSLRTLPQTAVISLTRHSYNDRGVQEKKRGLVPFPVDNLLFMPGHPDVPFLAVAIQCHTGTSPTSGHYRALVRATATKGSEWVVYDDSRVRRMESVNVAKEEAYVLVYRQLDPRDLVRYNAPPPSCSSPRAPPAEPASPPTWGQEWRRPPTRGQGWRR